jgi:hypothetical protein
VRRRWEGIAALGCSAVAASCGLVANLGEPRGLVVAGDAGLDGDESVFGDASPGPEGDNESESADPDSGAAGDGDGDTDGDVDGGVEVLRAQSLAVGPSHACAIVLASPGSPDNGTIRCWGSNASGELGSPPTSTPNPVPQPVYYNPSSLLGGATAISLAGDSSCAIGLGGFLLCWGDVAGLSPGAVSRVGGPTGYQPSELLLNGNSSSFTTISLGDGGGCALMPGGPLLCWGAAYSTHAEGGVGYEGIYPLGTASVGRAHTCAVTADSTNDVACWGDNSKGQVGVPGAGTTVPFPVSLGLGSAGNAVAQVAAGGDHSCALLADSVYCWGDNTFGQLGDGTKSSSPTPRLVRFPQGVKPVKPRQLSLGANHSCAWMDDFSVRCWGDNSKSQLAQDPSVLLSALPVVVQKGPGMALPSAASVAAGGDTTCAIRLGVSRLPISCWGNNDAGQAGQPLTASVVPYATPMSL